MTLQELNNKPIYQLKELLSQCCGAKRWVEKMCKIFPVEDDTTLLQQAEIIWYNCDAKDWLEAFTHHPKIGDLESLKKKFASTAAWTSVEQSGVKHATQQVLEALSQANKSYEEKFGYIFIVCASGKSAEEMLNLLSERLHNKPEDEIRIAMHEQNKITKIRIEKLLSS